MNDPYSTRRPDLPELGRLFREWNQKIERSRLDYRLTPTAACGVTDCDRLRIYGAMCKHHAHGGK